MSVQVRNFKQDPDKDALENGPKSGEMRDSDAVSFEPESSGRRRNFDKLLTTESEDQEHLETIEAVTALPSKPPPLQFRKV